MASINYNTAKQNLLNYNKDALIEMLLEAHESGDAQDYIDELFESFDDMNNDVEWNDDENGEYED
jgi:hypothetical protein